MPRGCSVMTSSTRRRYTHRRRHDRRRQNAFVEKLGAKPRRIASLYLGRREGDRLLYAGKAQTGFAIDEMREIRERPDPFIIRNSPLRVGHRVQRGT
jgi:ATP dependent DNA ligase C terminal region